MLCLQTHFQFISTSCCCSFLVFLSISNCCECERFLPFPISKQNFQATHTFDLAPLPQYRKSYVFVALYRNVLPRKYTNWSLEKCAWQLINVVIEGQQLAQQASEHFGARTISKNNGTIVKLYSRYSHLNIVQSR